MVTSPSGLLSRLLVNGTFSKLVVTSFSKPASVVVKVIAGCVTVAVVVVTLLDVVVPMIVVPGPVEIMTVTIGTVPIAVVTKGLGENVVVITEEADQGEVIVAGTVLPILPIFVAVVAICETLTMVDTPVEPDRIVTTMGTVSMIGTLVTNGTSVVMVRLKLDVIIMSGSAVIVVAAGPVTVVVVM